LVGRFRVARLPDGEASQVWASVQANLEPDTLAWRQSKMMGITNHIARFPQGRGEGTFLWQAIVLCDQPARVVDGVHEDCVVGFRLLVSAPLQDHVLALPVRVKEVEFGVAKNSHPLSDEFVACLPTTRRGPIRTVLPRDVCDKVS
jgi:hypothetical protein